MTLLIAGMELIATIAAIIAVIYAVLVFKKTRKASALWFFMLIALISLTVLRGLVTFEWGTGFESKLLEHLQLVFYIMTASYLLGFAYLSSSNLLNPI